jgi:hypothetical protein
MKRFHLIELHEQRWMPAWLRRGFVETLGAVFKLTGVYRNVAPIYARWIKESGGREVLDLASGAAGPTEDLLLGLCKAGIEPPAFCLSDIFPMKEDFRLAALANPHHISCIEEPIDALSVPPPYGRDLRQMVSAFHHFPPEQARMILRDAIERSRGICILEPFERNPRHLALALLGIFPALIAPLLARRWRLSHFIASWIIPIIPLMLVFDGIVSVLRIYTRDEIDEMIAAAGGESFRWSISSTRFMGVFHTTCVFGRRKTDER